MIQRVYIDTSVVGGCFDEEFEFYTKLFFEKVEQGKFKVIQAFKKYNLYEGLASPALVRVLTNQLKKITEYLCAYAQHAQHKI